MTRLPFVCPDAPVVAHVRILRGHVTGETSLPTRVERVLRDDLWVGDFFYVTQVEHDFSWVEVLPAAKFLGSRHRKFGIVFEQDIFTVGVILGLHVVKDFVPLLGSGCGVGEPSVKPQKGNGEFGGILVGELGDGHVFLG